MQKAQWQLDAEDQGYKEAMLDVALFLTGDGRVMDTTPDRFALVVKMVEYVNSKPNRLQPQV